MNGVIMRGIYEWYLCLGNESGTGVAGSSFKKYL